MKDLHGTLFAASNKTKLCALQAKNCRRTCQGVNHRSCHEGLLLMKSFNIPLGGVPQIIIVQSLWIIVARQKMEEDERPQEGGDTQTTRRCKLKQPRLKRSDKSVRRLNW